MTIAQKYYLGASAAILAIFAGTLVAYPYLPAIVPIHWDIHGQIDGWGPKWSLLIFGPGSMAFVVLLFSALPWLSPKRFEVDSFRATYLYIMVVIVSLLAYIHLLVLAVVLGAPLGVKLDVSRAAMGGGSLLFTLMGNVLGKVRRNFFIGVRTPWTIASEPVWNATHRFAAKTFFAGGLAGLVFTVLGTPFWLPLAAILTAALAPVFYSLVVYKQLQRRGEL
jgi:uncharacterized membrane protein